MPRDLSPEEEREYELSELEVKHLQRLQGQLQAGNADVASAIGEAISGHMTDDILNEQLAYAVSGAASPRFRKLVEQALKDAAEVAALKELEQLERQRQESQDDNRIARAELARMDNHNWRTA